MRASATSARCVAALDSWLADAIAKAELFAFGGQCESAQQLSRTVDQV
jgi:hypothetical protein